MNIDQTAMLTGWLMGRKVATMMVKPTAEVWKTVWEGEVTTTAGNNKNIYTDWRYTDDPTYGDLSSIPVGTTMRLTIDEDTRIYALTGNDDTGLLVNHPRYCGNEYLYDKKVSDDGFGLYLMYSLLNNPDNARETAIYTRTPGTHFIKIERKR